MPEPTPPANGQAPNNSNQPPANGTAPTNAQAPAAPALDLSKLSDEDFGKIFEDERLYKHPRFKNLSDRAKQGDAAAEAAKKAEEERLKKQGEFQTLADTKTKEAEEWKNKYNQSVIDNQTTAAALKAGILPANLGAVLKLVDRSKITVNADGTAAGIDEAIKAVLEAYPVFKGKSGATTIGSPTAPGGTDGQVKRFKLSQLQNAEFYRANEKDIQIALKNKAIENDL